MKRKASFTKGESGRKAGHNSKRCPLHGCTKRATARAKTDSFVGFVCKEHARWLRECERSFRSTRRLLLAKYSNKFNSVYQTSKNREVLGECIVSSPHITKRQAEAA